MKTKPIVALFLIAKSNVMTKIYPFYKIIISYFNLADTKTSHTESVLVFHEEKPIDSRKKAIERFRSLEDIFEQGVKNGNLLQSITHLFDSTITSQAVPSLNLYICENDNAEDDLVLYGSLLESIDERLLELTDEYELYHKSRLDHEGLDLCIDKNGKIYTILKDSLIHEDDNVNFKPIAK